MPKTAIELYILYIHIYMNIIYSYELYIYLHLFEFTDVPSLLVNLYKEVFISDTIYFNSNFSICFFKIGFHFSVALVMFSYICLSFYITF